MSKYGITEIVLPGRHETLASSATKQKVKDVQIKGTNFNEDFYRATYDDLVGVIGSRKYPSGYDHYLQKGMEEGRVGMHTGGATEFNEDNYLKAYPDVKAKVDGGKYRCGAHHYWMVGRSEGKKKNPGGGSKLPLPQQIGPALLAPTTGSSDVPVITDPGFTPNTSDPTKAHQLVSSSSKTIDTIVQPPSIPNGIEKPKVNLSFKTKLTYDVFDLRTPDATLSALRDRHSQEHNAETQLVMDSINAGKVGIFDKNISINEASHIQALFMRLVKRLNPMVAKPVKIDVENLQIKVAYKQLKKVEQKIWEVFFDHKKKGSSGGQRIDPLILDLNKDKKFDITGANQEGNGKIDGDTVSFDIDPSKQSWKNNSPGHRPGFYEGRSSRYCAPIPNGKAVYDSGSTENFGPKGVWYENASKGNQAKIFDQSGKWVGEWVKDHWRSHGRVGRYYFSPYDQNEETEWLKKDLEMASWFGIRMEMESSMTIRR